MPLPQFTRQMLGEAVRRLSEPRRRMQVLAGPRQVGKTTLALQALGSSEVPSHYATADDPALRDRAWLEAQWEIGRNRARRSQRGAALVLDEIQKLPDWSEVVKRLWDEDTRRSTSSRRRAVGRWPWRSRRARAGPRSPG